MSNLHLHAARLTAHDWEQGRAWYARAHEEARALATLAHGNNLAPDARVERGAAIIAALSPQTPWARNLELARALVSGAPRLATFGASERRARAALVAEKPLEAIGGGPKSNAFARNIAYPGTSMDVTLDIWALRLVLDLGREGKVPTLTPKKYDALANEYRATAKAFGVLPLVLQAATWVHIRGAAI